MSSSLIFLIDKEYNGEAKFHYGNSWIFAPVIWDVLLNKYFSEEIKTPFGFKKSIIADRELEIKLNDLMNNSSNMTDRICWELSGQQIFYSKDKELVKKAILNFVEDNKNYYLDKNNECYLSKEHIKDRFLEIAEDISKIDENKCPFFVFKNSSIDDTVEYWFEEFNEEADEYEPISLDKRDFRCAEFVIIENGKIVEFIDNLNFKY